MNVVVFPTGSLSDEDRKSLLVNGVVAVECDDPQQVVAVIPHARASGDHILMAALDAVATGGYSTVNQHFAQKLNELVQSEEKS